MTQSFGAYLQQARLAKGLSQTEVARKLGYSTPQFVSNWERGRCAPAEDSYPKLIKMYGLSERQFRLKLFDYGVDVLYKKIFGKPRKVLDLKLD